MSFHNPSAFWLLLFLPIIACLYLVYFRYRRHAVSLFYTDPTKQENVLRKVSQTDFGKLLLYLLAWVFLTISLAHPISDIRYLYESTPSTTPSPEKITTQRVPHEIQFFLDTSLSMSTDDTRKEISRLNYAKEIIEAILTKLNGQNTSLYSITSQVTPLVPATVDYLFLRLMLEHLSYNEGDISGTDFSIVIKQMAKIWESDSRRKLKTVILLSDGDDTQLLNQTPRERKKIEKEMLIPLDELQSERVKIITIGIGSKAGGKIPNFAYQDRPVHSRLEDSLLKRIADKGEGEYLYSQDETPLGIATEVYSFIQEQEEKSATISEEAYLNSNQDQLTATPLFQIPLGFSLLCLAGAYLIPYKREEEK